MLIRTSLLTAFWLVIQATKIAKPESYSVGLVVLVTVVAQLRGRARTKHHRQLWRPSCFKGQSGRTAM